MLASNESPDPPLQRSCGRAARGRGRQPLPGPLECRAEARAEQPLRRAGARIAIGNGSCDILLAAGEALLEPGAELVYAWPSFSVYPHLAAASGARAITVDLDDNHCHDLDAMLTEITAATRLVIVCNPNNPTSTALPFADIAAFVARVPRHVAVIVDEAYCEFNMLDDPDTTLDLLAKHPNLVLLRTFSKVTGSAACASASRCAAPRTSRAPSTRSASRSSATWPRRPRPSRRSSTRTPSPTASSARSWRASRFRRARGARDRARRVAGELLLVRPAGGRRRGRGRARPRRPRRHRARRWGARPRRRAACDVWHTAQNVRFLDALAAVL